MSGWKRQAQAGLQVAGASKRRQKDHDATIHDLHAKIRGADGGTRFFITRARALSRAERMLMIDRGLKATHEALRRAARSVAIGAMSGTDADSILRELEALKQNVIREMEAAP